MQSKHWVVWNLFLACVPVILAYALSLGVQKFTLQRRIVPWFAWLPLALAWFAFLPNSCYLFTEWRHFLFDPTFTSGRNVNPTGDILLRVARQSLVTLLYTVTGLLSFGLAIRPVHRLLQKKGWRPEWWAVPFFFLISLGVYLGLIPRLNSWDLFRHPLYVLQQVLMALFSFRLLKVIVIFAAALWLLYMVVDIWVDGAKLRYQRMAARKTTSGEAPT